MSVPRLFDLDRQVTVKQVEGELENAARSVEQRILALIEHWTDDEGLHHAPFQASLLREIEEALESITYNLSK